MSFVMDILEHLWYVAWNATAYYKGRRINILGFPMPWKPDFKRTPNSINGTVNRLAKNGIIEIKDGEWWLTDKGKKYFEEKKKLHTKFSSPFVLNAPKNLLLMFDVPESKKSERNWLRWHLIEFQYYMIQKSVWVGPSPLPPKFRAYLKEIGIEKYIKTFKLAKPYICTK